MLPTNPPAWVARYVGLEFMARGRSIEGVDCWGLVRLVYAERFGVDLPSHSTGYQASDDAPGIARVFEQESSAWRAIDAAEARVGDVAVFRVDGREGGHVGLIVARGLMLHSWGGTKSCLERTDSRLWSPRLVAVMRHAAPVRLIGSATPFAGRRVFDQFAAGLTIEQMLAAKGIASPLVRVFVGDVEVPREHWTNVRPKAGRIVQVAAVPLGGAGGGKTALRVVASLAIIAAAASLGPEVALAAGYLETGSAAAIFTAGIGMAGMLAVNALIPTPQPRLSLSGGGDDLRSQSPSLTGGRNDLRNWGVVPLPLGEFRWAPPYAAVPYVEMAGNDQYLRCVFNLGYGPIDASAIQIGETAIEEYEGVELEFRPGREDDAPLSLYPSLVRDESLSVELTYPLSWVQRTTERDVTEISVDITFPNGLVEFAGDGTKLLRTVDVEVQYRRVGDTDWLAVNGDGGTEGSPLDYRQMDLLFRTPEVAPGGTGTHANDLNWSADQVAYPDAKPAYLPLAGYSWMVEGFVYCETAGVHQFCVDSSDAADVHVDWREVASWYGEHDTEVTAATIDSTTHAGAPITLSKGWHAFRARVEHRGGSGGALAVGWKRPGDAAFSIIPQHRLSTAANYFSDSLKYTWYRTGTYGSAISTTEAQAESLRRSKAWAVPEGQYEVRLRRLTADSSSSQVLDKVYWTTLRSITAEDPLPMTGVAKLAVRIKASEQLNGVLDTLTVLTRSICPDWDEASQTWIDRATSNAASLYRAVLEGRGHKRPIATSRIDLSELARWHEENTTRGLSYNAVVDYSSTLHQVLNEIAASARATFGMRDGLFSVIVDREQTAPVQHFTPKNTWGFSATKAFPEIPHALRVRFVNSEAGYQQDERIVLADGYQIDGVDAWGNAAGSLPLATRFEVLELASAMTGVQAFKQGRYYLAVLQLRPEVFEFNTDVEFLACNRGDMVRLGHDVPLLGQSSGRILALHTDTAGDVTGVDIDELVGMDIGEAYTLRVRLDTAQSILAPVVNVPGETSTLTFAGPISDPKPKAGDLWGFGRLGLETREVLIKSIDVHPDMTATIRCIDHAPAVHLADQGTIPPWQSGIDRPPTTERRPDDPIIESIRSDDTVMVRDADGSLRMRMLVQLKAVSGTSPIPTHVQVIYRIEPDASGSGAGSWRQLPPLPLINNAFSIMDVEQGVRYHIRLRTVTAEGLTSHWVDAFHVVEGKATPPPDVSSFSVARLSDGTRKYWWDVEDPPLDLAGVVIRYGPPSTSWEHMTPLHEGVIEASPVEMAVPDAGTWRFGIRAIDTSDNLSVNPLYIDATLGEPPLDGVVFSKDDGLSGWPGTKSLCHVSTWNTGSLLQVLEADDRSTWATLASYGSATWDTWPRWNLSPESPIVYESTTLDAGIIFEFTPDALVGGYGDVLCELAWSSDGSSWSDWTALTTARERSVTARYLKARVTVDPTPSVVVCVIHRLVLLMRAESKTYDIQDLDTSTLDAGRIVGVGDVYLPVPPGLFRLIRGLNLGFNGVGAGYSWERIELDPTVGPRVRIYNAQDLPSHAVIDASIRGV